MLYHLRRNPQLEPEIAARREALARDERGADALRALSSEATLDLIASFQRSVVDNLISRTIAAVVQQGARTVLVSGGVAANSELRRAFEAEAAQRGIEVYFPSRALSTDNAAMIAAAGHARFLAGERADSVSKRRSQSSSPLAFISIFSASRFRDG